MMLAQNLYEHGLITYIRTDSVNLAPSAITSARDYIGQSFGKSYLPPTARLYKSKSKNAQEAHEAIRPTDVKVLGEAIKGRTDLNKDHIRVYDLIWKRFLASQMMEAVMNGASPSAASALARGILADKRRCTCLSRPVTASNRQRVSPARSAESLKAA